MTERQSPATDASAAQVYFKLKVQQGLADLAAGRVVTDDEARKRFAKWLNPGGGEST